MTNSAATPRARKATGPGRPQYLTGADTDKLVAIVLALMSEVSSLRERLDAHERLADAGSLPSSAAVESYRPDKAVETVRATWRKAFIRRLFRVVVEEIQVKQDAGASDSLGDVG